MDIVLQIYLLAIIKKEIIGKLVVFYKMSIEILPCRGKQFAIADSIFSNDCWSSMACNKFGRLSMRDHHLFSVSNYYRCLKFHKTVL